MDMMLLLIAKSPKPSKMRYLCLKRNIFQDPNESFSVFQPLYYFNSASVSGPFGHLEALRLPTSAEWVCHLSPSIAHRNTAVTTAATHYTKIASI